MNRFGSLLGSSFLRTSPQPDACAAWPATTENHRIATNVGFDSERVVFRWVGGVRSMGGSSTITDRSSELMAKQPKNPFHPGEILLEEFLEPLGMSQAGFAE